MSFSCLWYLLYPATITLYFLHLLSVRVLLYIMYMMFLSLELVTDSLKYIQFLVCPSALCAYIPIIYQVYMCNTCYSQLRVCICYFCLLPVLVSMYTCPFVEAPVHMTTSDLLCTLGCYIVTFVTGQYPNSHVLPELHCSPGCHIIMPSVSLFTR
jgi:hypothetical protein